MRIHIINPTLNKLTGVTKLTIDLALSLRKMLPKEDIILHGPMPPKDLILKVERAKIGLNCINMGALVEHYKRPLDIVQKLKLNHEAIKNISKEIDINDIVVFTDGFYLAPLVKKYARAKVIIYHYFPYSLSYRWWRTDFTLLEQGMWGNKFATSLAKLEAFLYKQRFVDIVVVYSNFVAKVFKKYLSVPAIAIPPPIDTELYRPLRKHRNLILTVTRFHPDKELDKLLIIFAKGIVPFNNDAEMIVAGRVLKEHQWYYKLLLRLANKARGRIRVIPSPSESELAKLYGEATIFWYIHQEHCATTPVEAMVAGAVPVILDKPGLREAIDHGYNGIIAKNISEFVKWTLKLLNNKTIMERLSINARKTAIMKFSPDSFGRRFTRLVLSLMRY